MIKSKGKFSTLFIAGLVLGSIALTQNNAQADTVDSNVNANAVSAVKADAAEVPATNLEVSDNGADQSAVLTTSPAQTGDEAAATSNDAAATTSAQADQTASTQASIYMDTQAVAANVLSELNNLRAQNNLPAINNVDSLNGYAQSRADVQVGRGGVSHADWSSDAMAPYDHDAKEALANWDIASLPNDPYQVAVHFIKNFYTEEKAPEGTFGHRKALLDPYLSNVGVGVSMGNGIMVVALEFGNDAATESSYDQQAVQSYNDTFKNGFANYSRYDKSSLNDTDHTTKTDNYVPFDTKGEVSTFDSLVDMVDRNGNVYDSPRLAPWTTWYTDILARINGKLYYRVSNNGFVSINDVRASAYVDLYLSTPQPLEIFNDNMVSTGRYTQPNTEYHVDRRTMDGTALRVGEGQWVINITNG